MKHAWVIAAVVGCGSPGPVRHEPAPVPLTPPPPAVSQVPTPIAHASRLAVEASHAGSIVTLTASPERDAVLSADELGGVRLWPALDGTQEPKLVELPQAKALVIGHRGDGYTAVALDEVGGLYVARLDRDGRTLSHTTIGSDPAFADMVMSASGLIAWRVDHHVLIIDGDGAIKAELAAEPQQRIVDIAVQGNRALALLEMNGGIKTRWLTLEPRLAWGAWIDHADPSGRTGLAIALAPDLAHFALATRDDKAGSVGIFEVAGGKPINTTPIAPDDVDIAFADRTVLAIASHEAGVSWLLAKERTLPTRVLDNLAISGRHQLAVGGGGQAILGFQSELVLATPTATQFLGYQSPTPEIAAPGADGGLLVIGDTANPATLLDRTLRATSKPNLGLVPNAGVVGLQWVGGDTWLVEWMRTDNRIQLAIVNGGTGKATIVRELPDLHYLAYEPTTHLVTLSFGQQSEVATLDAAAGTLDRITNTPKRTPYATVLAPLSPKLARGQQLMEITIHDKAAVKWFKTAGAAATSSLILDGSYLGTDAAGRLYAWQGGPSGKLGVVIYTDGKRTGTLPTQGPAALWPDPTATLIAEATAHGVTLYEGNSVVWTRSVEGVREVYWLSDGSLALVHASGIARLDAGTGVVSALRCGSDFGLSPKQHPPSPRVEPICAQLVR